MKAVVAGPRLGVGEVAIDHSGGGGWRWVSPMLQLGSKKGTEIEQTEHLPSAGVTGETKEKKVVGRGRGDGGGAWVASATHRSPAAR